MSKLKQLFKFSKGKEEEEDFITVGELFKLVTECSPKNITAVITRSVPRLLNIVNKYDYKASADLHRQLSLSLWTSLSLLSLVQVQSQEELDNFETEFLKRKVEREHERIVNVIITHYNNNDIFLRDYLAFISIAGLWIDPSVSNYLLGFIPTERVYVEEFLKNTCKVMIDEFWKKNEDLFHNISDIMSFLILDKDWISTSYGSQLCIEYLLNAFESVYDNEDDGLSTVDNLLMWMRYLVERVRQPEHISDLLEVFCIWLYFHAKNIHQAVNIGSLIFLCCDLYHPLTIQLSLKHFFQNVVLCMINSNEMSIVSIGYDIIISITDRLGNRAVLTNPKIYHLGELHQLKKPTRHSLGETLFSREDFIHMTDSILKVVVNSIKRFINSKIVARKVNTLVSLLAIEGCDSAEGLTSVISFALSVQDTMLQMSRQNSARYSIMSGEDIMHPDSNTLLYHGSVASWFSLVCSVNHGDLDLFRNYVKSVIDLRADSAPYLLPSQDPVPLLPYYIYEMDKSLYFDIDQIQDAIENSWVILTNDRDLLNSIKIPRSTLLVEKYVDLQLLDSFNAFLTEEKLDKDYSEDQVSQQE